MLGISDEDFAQLPYEEKIRLLNEEKERLRLALKAINIALRELFAK